MPLECRKTTSGGKGNLGMFIERDPDIVAAGLPTAQSTETAADSLQHYLMQEEADALISDAIVPTPPPRPLPPLRKPIPRDMRNSGPFGDVPTLVNPPTDTKFQTLVKEFKETSYKSYWKTPVGRVPDPTPMLPEGFDILGTTFGKPTPCLDTLYDVVMPKVPYPDKTPPNKEAGVQLRIRNYCKPSYNPDLTFGKRTFVDKRGTFARCCLTNDKILLGSGNKMICNSIQANLQNTTQARIGEILAPNDNQREVPKDYTFGILKPPGNLSECFTNCELNKELDFFRKCVRHLNTLRKGLSKRFLPTFFHNFYLKLKYYDTDKTGWLSRDFVYKQCGIVRIRFDPALIEPLLSMWRAFDGTNIEYKTFVHVINYREPSSEMPKVLDFKPECLDYSTTYTDMVKPGQDVGNRLMAGIPSGRYIDMDFPISPDRCLVADRVCLPHESDMKSCLSPSILTKLFVNHRHMYEKQDPANVRRVFEAAGEKFTDKRFNAIWEEAQKWHSEGWVCYETFRRTLEQHPDELEFETKEEKND
ncbi:EF-hand domain-containing family member B-like [Anticarsia gemmatalis]|uniref:EF-hand domain-containing family member B-like n=1 Tax=Anticarsia gemmatalis TaxID=129554 RepID=UPI003F763DBB